MGSMAPLHSKSMVQSKCSRETSLKFDAVPGEQLGQLGIDGVFGPGDEEAWPGLALSS